MFFICSTDLTRGIRTQRGEYPAPAEKGVVVELVEYLENFPTVKQKSPNVDLVFSQFGGR